MYYWLFNEALKIKLCVKLCCVLSKENKCVGCYGTQLLLRLPLIVKADVGKVDLFAY